MSEYVVTTNADDGSGSLRAALASAGDGDTIDFALTPQTSTISLKSGALVITHSVAIEGAGSVTVDGGGSSTDFISDVGTSGSASIHGLNIVGGNGVGAKGADGQVSPTDLTQYSTPGDGGDAAGGILVRSGHLDLADDAFSGNVAVGGKGGDAASFSPGGNDVTPFEKSAGGTGGNAAGAVYIEPNASVTAAGLTYGDGNSGTGGAGGYGLFEGTFTSTGQAPGPTTNGYAPNGQGYDLSNDPAVACYCPGTAIATVRGDVAVEDLEVGDRVVTAGGRERPIVWIGRRAYAARHLRNEPPLRPIAIAAGALGAGLPLRTLRVSPRHALLLEGVLVPAGALAGVVPGIVREGGEEGATYLHVELDAHDVLLAEGAAAESFIDDGSRGMFHASRGRPAPATARFAPLVENGHRFAAIVRRLNGAGFASAATEAAEAA